MRTHNSQEIVNLAQDEVRAKHYIRQRNLVTKISEAAKVEKAKNT